MLGTAAHRPAAWLLRFVAVLLFVWWVPAPASAVELGETQIQLDACGHERGESSDGDCCDDTHELCLCAVQGCSCCATVAASMPVPVSLPQRTVAPIQSSVGAEDLRDDGIRSRIDRPPRG